MAKETPEERIARQIISEATRKEAFRATLPARMISIQILAKEIGNISTEVTLRTTGPCLRVWENGEGYLDEQIHSDSEDWEVDHIEQVLKGKKVEVDAQKARRIVAMTVWNKLTSEERVAVRENLHSLRD